MTGRWREEAACLGADPQLFDPPDYNERVFGDTDARIAKAAAVCAGCPVAAACMDDAVTHRDSGVRAGVLLDGGRPAKISHAGRPPQHSEPQRLSPCGTRAAYERHRRHGEEPCRPCQLAKAEHDRPYALAYARRVARRSA